MTITNTPEYQLSVPQHLAISALLQECFPQYPSGRTHFRQLPQFRILATAEDGTLIGHIAVEHRMVNNAGQLLRVFGLADVCVSPDYRDKGLGANLLDYSTTLAQNTGIDALLLIAHEPEFYLKNDFLAVENECKWLFVQGDQTLGVLNRHIKGLMVKMLNGEPWRAGQLDLLGHIF
ncbi:GNAT family N-acetyltransferase [Haliscomenobacter hydrossis]|uniref:GCN5-related N-acetyltransferase n=1 Tax=Haliscomenobacter hydrossis (strain ATCC 27775 / DSM 1100 / LMG 10767 / O) TaxID=760192 RepID=F4KWX8_HALH1|nr:GNAT family N-acetyltransferase [Haliscomenobacter hydrossis]AEE53578.1 GCN5-related N-acetyltransferase [Haliscomenobacter hydrossis DSM 1100]